MIRIAFLQEKIEDAFRSVLFFLNKSGSNMQKVHKNRMKFGSVEKKLYFCTDFRISQK